MKRTTISQIAIIAAVLAALFAALWVWSYIEVTSIDPPYAAPIALREFVYGQEYGIEGPATDLLFVVVTRSTAASAAAVPPSTHTNTTIGQRLITAPRPVRWESRRVRHHQDWRRGRRPRHDGRQPAESSAVRPAPAAAMVVA